MRLVNSPLLTKRWRNEMKPKVVIVIPAYNEENKVGMTVKGVNEQLRAPPLASFESEVIVIDDGSTDNTFQRAQLAGAIVLRHFVNLGLGAALGTGFSAALRRGATIIVTFDADGQHNPRDIPRIISPILDNTADAAVGSRLQDPSGMPLDRRVINWGANLITWLLFGVWTTDSQSGLRALNRIAVERIQIKTNRMEVSSEIVAEIGQLGLRFAEVPIEAIYTDYSREKGQSNANALSILSKLILRKAR
jgi:glycosyltransferase involved in cell wall biosynthesis